MYHCCYSKAGVATSIILCSGMKILGHALNAIVVTEILGIKENPV